MAWTDLQGKLQSGADELQALAENAVMSPLTNFAVIAFSGDETEAFLQGQLSSDVRALGENAAQYSSYSTAKGRMLASFLVFRRGNDYCLQIAAELQEAIQKRLSMFVMRSKTKARDASSELCLLGVAGPLATEKLSSVLGALPDVSFVSMHKENCTVIALPGQRYQLVITADAALALWQKLAAAGIVAAEESLWRLSDIRAGVPWVSAATQEAFVAQMANLELIGGVSFTKGCYPGQEIVARTQYLGKLKRRMYRARIATELAGAGQDVFSSEMNGQASGKVMLAAQAGQGRWEVLLVAQIASLEHGLHLGSIDGPLLEMLDLPYSL
ncbi:CAF17-like 4Fe-4S cluster assembly/insertion protein YgfZ [Iodobacter ciconiae]|uniref:Folate-binding protein n=1 Tax=Iodobacter ciconiae TaxID=2496266 RepID=A0A3S8ZTB7_9NEIS|nr:folate-binding protein YgfZ [Iodobacter ciconiae]AZN36753.1 folate-binding protein [Iodobacter ciconiae]